ncbi:MAG: hypothetical protein ABJF04_18455 [Reichenbachiella sp.]|uniref:hypothetical protein n=4 Tax=Reichenbachiella sp. TaxID=2184521 RepID=UPI0032668FDC
MDRGTFIKKGILAASGLAVLPSPSFASPQGEVFDKQEIKDFVFAAHKDFEETKRIVEQKPLILNCTNQPQRGDFETAVGGASHMGRRDIADLLVSKGARLDIFNYAFLGYDEFIMKLLTDYPNLLKAPGPHGFTLLHHANVGDRGNLASWLQEKGLTETFIKGVFG